MRGSEEIEKRLLELDEEAALAYGNSEEKYRCVIVGGSALILFGYTGRVTHDIDCLAVPEDIRRLLQKYDMNTSVTAYLDSFPGDYEDRLIRIELETEKIDFFCISLEDLVISKLSTNRDKDGIDIREKAVLNKLDWNKLDALATDQEFTLLSDRQIGDFHYNYKNYREEFCPCDS